MNSKIIFDHVRSKLGGTQKQYDALLRILNNGTKIEDVSEFVGISTENIGLEQRPLSSPIEQRWVLSKRSIDRLDGVNLNLVNVVKRAIQISKYDFMVVEGVRTLETQKKYVAEGKSKTLDSYHLTGHAVDLAPIENGVIDWNNKKGQFDDVYLAMKQAAKELNVDLIWGGNWKSFVDKPHFQIKR